MQGDLPAVFPVPFRIGSENLRIGFDRTKTNHASAMIYSLLGSRVRSAGLSADAGLNASGPCADWIEWDGKNDAGQIVGAGGYVVRLTLVSNTGTTTTVFLRALAVR